jgi:glycosyltransferase involved in cell wall biosynthesis
MSKYGTSESSPSIRMHKFIEWISMQFADHVLTINEPISKLLEGRGLRVSKSTVIMNAVDDALFASATSTSAPALAGASATFVMMYHGTLTRIYGLDISIAAFGTVHEQMPGAEFWILGGGTERQALEALVQRLGLGGKVKFIGNVLPEEVPQWVRRCDVGVLATRRDVFLDFSFSNKISEYIIMGKGVIASRLKAIRHYYSEEAFAFFEPNNAEALSRQMLRLYGDPALRETLVARAKLEYAPICWDVMKSRYVKLMASLSGEAPLGDQTPSPVPNAAINEPRSAQALSVDAP